MSSEQITSMSPETVESKIDSIYDKMKNPDIQLMVEEQISQLTQQLPEFKWKTSQEIYERFWWEYSWTPQELAKVFSYIFRKVRDWIEIKDEYIQVNLQNSQSTLSIHEDGDIDNIIGSLNHAITIKSLKENIQYNWDIFIKIEFFWNNWKIKTWYISEKLTKTVDTNSLKQLNGYIRSIWLNPTKQLKTDTFQKVYFLKDYNENKTRDNNEVYHKLVQDYELRKLIELEECRLACIAELDNTKEKKKSSQNKDQTITSHEYPLGIISEFWYKTDWLTQEDIKNNSIKEKNKLSEEFHKNFIEKYIPDFLKDSTDFSKDKIQIPLRPIDQIKKEKKIEIIQPNLKNTDNKSVIGNQKIEKSKKLDSPKKINETEINTPDYVLNKIKNNQNIISYLETKYGTNNFEENFSKFQKSIWSSGNDFKSLVMSYTYLFQHSFNSGSSIQLWDYYKLVTWNNWWDLTSTDRNNLFKTHAWEVNEIYSWKKMSNNLTILRWLIIQHELGSPVEEKIENEQNKPIFIFEKHWLDINSMELPNAIYINWEPHCSQTVREEYYLKKHQIIATWTPAARDYIDQSLENWKVLYDRFSLDSEIRKQFTETWKNSFDVFPNTKDWHRVVMEVWWDKQIYVLDPYNYKKGPITLRQYLNIETYPNIWFILENGYKI